MLLHTDLKYSDMTRRNLLARASVGFASRIAVPAFSGSNSNLDFASALDAAAAIQSKQVSSVELTKHTFARVDQYNPKLNAFVYQTREQALAQARPADDSLSRGANRSTA